MKTGNDIFMMKNIIRELGYTSIGDTKSNRKTFFTKTLPKLVEVIQNKTFSEIDLQGQGIEKNIIPSNIFDIYTRLAILLELKISAHTDTLTEAGNLKDEL